MTRLLALLASVAIVAAACGDDSPSGPSGGTITPTTYSIPLTPANEVPAIANAEAVASGSATIVLRVTRMAAAR
jgi:ABC-type glycerol-3-phosphate transport system substrate-binding protein